MCSLTRMLSCFVADWLQILCGIGNEHAFPPLFFSCSGRLVKNAFGHWQWACSFPFSLSLAMADWLQFLFGIGDEHLPSGQPKSRCSYREHILCLYVVYMYIYIYIYNLYNRQYIYIIHTHTHTHTHTHIFCLSRFLVFHHCHFENESRKKIWDEAPSS